MGMPNGFILEIPNDGAGNAVVGTSKHYNASDLIAGYDFVRGGGAAFAGNIEGSVNGINWDTIASLAASGQGEIDSFYHLVRVKIGTGGALDGSQIWYRGKN